MKGITRTIWLDKLKKNRELYEKNYQLLKKSVGKTQHKKYVERERELNNEEIKIRKKLGLPI